MGMKHKMCQAAALAITALTLVTACSARSAGDATAAVDLNHATVAELMNVPGMTDVWARRIVRFRPYRRKTDLVDYGVISAEEYGKIRDHVVAHRVTDEKGKPKDRR
jgi:DNA uptake protein ComE-like DNA-binding protein